MLRRLFLKALFDSRGIVEGQQSSHCDAVKNKPICPGPVLINLVVTTIQRFRVKFEREQ